MPEEKPKVYASLGMKVNIGNYENQDISFGVSGILYDASPELLAEILPTATLTIQRAMNALSEEMLRNLRENYGRA